jgi:succinate dehydrogenase / fumarate reductase flavoprotein subunit
MLAVAECVARAALEREESRGGHTRDDFPAADPAWGRVNVVCTRTAGGAIEVARQDLPAMPADLAEIFEEQP